MGTDDLTKQIMAILAVEYEAMDRDDAVDPESLAHRARLRLDPQNEAPALMSWAAVLELRQLARSLCRRQHEEAQSAVESDQANLFAQQLQPRYPAMRRGREMYVKRMLLTLEERRQNIQALRSEAATKDRHARALEAETNRMLADGVFDGAA